MSEMKRGGGAPVEVMLLVNDKAENAILGIMRSSPDHAAQLAEELHSEDFHDPRRQLVFEALINLAHSVEPADDDALIAECRRVNDVRRGKMHIDRAYLESLTGEVRHAAMYTNIVRKLAWLRLMADFTHWAAEILQTRPDPDALYAEAQERLRTLRPATKDRRFVYGWDTVGVHAEIVIKRIDDHAAHIVQITFRWTWTSWTRNILPLRPGFVGIVAAPDGMGKTVVLEMIAEQWAQDGIHVVCVHLEDDLEYKLDRRLARHAFVEIGKIESGDLTPDEQQRLSEAQTRIGEWADHLHYYHAAGETMAAIVRELEARAAEGVCQAVVFDYLDKVQPTRTQATFYGVNTWERQADDMEQLKTFAERSRVPVMTATQGNRSMQDGGIQTRKAIQGSVQRSQKAQLVVILTRDLVGENGLKNLNGEVIARPGDYSPIVHVRIDKQNRGATGQFDQVLVGRYFRLQDIQQK